jgi:hypothetical protein
MDFALSDAQRAARENAQAFARSLASRPAVSGDNLAGDIVADAVRAGVVSPGVDLLTAAIVVEAVAWESAGAAVALANRHAWSHGLPPDARLGGGIFRPVLYRIPGVLQRIGVCYGIAATLALFAGWRTLLAALAILLAGYSALMLAVPFPGNLDFDPAHAAAFLARYRDRLLFGRDYYGSDLSDFLGTLELSEEILRPLCAGNAQRLVSGTAVASGAA